MRIQTYSINAYSRSRGIKLIEAFFECYKGYNELQELSDAQQLAVANDFVSYNKTFKVPEYVKLFLDHERLRQISLTPRYGPQKELFFGN